MSDISLTDVLATVYGADQPGAQSEGAPPRGDNSALLLIDIQVLVSPAYMLEAAINAGLPAGPARAALADYERRFDAAFTVCSKVLQTARAGGVPPIHVKMEALSGDGRDTSPLYRRLGWSTPLSGAASAFLTGVTPLPGEIVLTKTVGGAFTGTNLDRVLRHMGIEHLFLCGFMTDECVETTLRDALDLGYLARVIRDAATAYVEADHAHVIRKFGAYGLTPDSDEVVGTWSRFSEA